MNKTIIRQFDIIRAIRHAISCGLAVLMVVLAALKITGHHWSQSLTWWTILIPLWIHVVLILLEYAWILWRVCTTPPPTPEQKVAAACRRMAQAIEANHKKWN